jgi:hypothetical protein
MKLGLRSAKLEEGLSVSLFCAIWRLRALLKSHSPRKRHEDRVNVRFELSCLSHGLDTG